MAETRRILLDGELGTLQKYEEASPPRIRALERAITARKKVEISEPGRDDEGALYIKLFIDGVELFRIRKYR